MHLRFMELTFFVIIFITISSTNSSNIRQNFDYDQYNIQYDNPYHWPQESFEFNSQESVPKENINPQPTFKQDIQQPAVAAQENNKNFFGNIFEAIFGSTTVRTTTLSTVQQDCIDNCIMRPPSHYNPVCGTNGESYQNEERLICIRDCGVDVALDRIGTCRPLTTSIVSGVPPA